MKAVVLAAGKGERLWPLTETRPKPLLPIGNRPILERTLDVLVAAGIRKVILVVNYMEKAIRDRIGSGAAIGSDIEYVRQKRPSGTADAVGSAETNVEGNDSFLVIYGDDYFDKGSVREFVDKAGRKNGITIGTCKVKDASPFGRLEVRNGRVLDIEEKMAKPGPGLVNTGLYMMNRSLFSTIRKTTRSKRGEFELTDSLKALIRKGEPVHSEELGDSGWVGISYPWDLLEANEQILKKQQTNLNGEIEQGVLIKGGAVIEKGAVLKAGCRLEGPVHIGQNCQVGPNAYLRSYTCLGDDARVGAASEIKNSIVMAGTKIPHLSYIGDSVLGEYCSLGAGTITANLRFDEAAIKSRVKGALVSSGRKKLGAVMGDEVRTGINVSIFPGVKVGHGAWLGPSAIVEKDVASGARIKAA